MRPRILLATAFILSALNLPAQSVKDIRVYQEGHFITRPDEGNLLISDNPVTGYKTASYKTPSLYYEYVIDRNFQLISYKASINDKKLVSIFMANIIEITRTETGYTYRKKWGYGIWEEVKLAIKEPVIYFGGISNYLEEKLKPPGALPEAGKMICLIPPFLPVEVNFTITRTTSDKIPAASLPLTQGKPPANFRQFMEQARPIWLAEFKLTGLAWAFYPHPFCFALEDDEEPQLLANWGGRTDTEDYFIVYAPSHEPMNAVCR